MLFELKKVFGHSIIAIGIIFLIGFTFVYSKIFFFQHSNDKKKPDMKEEEVYENCQGTYSVEKAGKIYQRRDELIEKMGETNDNFDILNQYLILCSSAKNCEEVYEYRERVCRSAARLKQSDDVYTERLNEKIEKMYQKELKLNIQNGQKTKDLSIMLKLSDPVDCICLVFLILVSVSLFLPEHRKNMFPMIYTSYEGRGKTYVRKMCLAMGFAASVAWIQTMGMVLPSFFIGSSQEWIEPIQGVEYFKYSPYMLNMVQLVLVIALLRSLGYMVLCGIFTVITLGFKNNLLPMILNTFLGVAGIVICSYFTGYSPHIYPSSRGKRMIYPFFREFTPYALISDGVGYLAEYEPVNFLGYPVSVLVISIVVNILLLGIIFLAGSVFYEKRFRKKGA